MISKRRDCWLMKCTTVLHGGVYHRTSTPHKSGTREQDEEEEEVNTLVMQTQTHNSCGPRAGYS